MNRARWLWLLSILLVATALRFYRVGDMSLRADEATNLFLAAEEPSAIIQPFITTDPHLPIYYLILHYWMLSAGQSELAVRYPTVFAGILVVALVAALSRTVFPRQPQLAVVAALFAAINPYLVWDAQDAYMYSYLTALLLASWITFLRALRPNASARIWISYVLTSALALFFHYLAALVLIAQAAIWLFSIITHQISRRIATLWLVALAAIAALFLPWLVFALPLLKDFSSNFLEPVGLIEMFWRVLIAFSVGRVDNLYMPAMVEPWIGNVFGVAFLVLFLLGLFAHFKKDLNGRVVLATYIFFPLVALFVFSSWRFPIFDERYTLFLIPAFVLIVARGLAQIENKALAACVVVLVFVASGHSLYNYFYVPAFAKSPNWHSFTRRLVADARLGDVIIQNYPDPALPYYLQNRVPRVLLPHTSSEPPDVVAADLDHLAAKYDRIWFQPVPYGTWDTGGIVATWLNRYALETNAFQFRGLRLELYLPISVALRQAKSVNAMLGDQIRLVAFGLNRATGDVTKPGTSMHIVLYWQALDHIVRDYTVFVHLYRSDGQLESQHDSQPLQGTFPTSAWATNDIVVDTYDVPIPPNAPHGTYLLAAGMYDPQTMERLNASASDGNGLAENRIPLMNVTVVGEASQ